MKSLRTMLALGALAALVMAGCSGSGSDSPASGWELSHAEASELTRITIESLPDAAPAYSDLMVDVDGKLYAFGASANFEQRRYQVDGKFDATEPIEMGDILTVPAAGLVDVAIIIYGSEAASFEANIPDNAAPDAPMIVEPADHASGVSRMPTFRWTMESDPSGVSYELVYSPDPAFAAPVLTKTVDDLTVTSYAVPSGQDLLGGATYFWRVQAIDGAGNESPRSEVGEFTVAG